MRPIDRSAADERRASIDRMIEEFRAAKQRQFLRRPIRLRRKDEVDQVLRLEAPPDRIH